MCVILHLVMRQCAQSEQSRAILHQPIIVFKRGLDMYDNTGPDTAALPVLTCALANSDVVYIDIMTTIQRLPYGFRTTLGRMD